MHNIAISNELYTEAARVANASGLSLERFIAEAVEYRLQIVETSSESESESEKETIELTPEQLLVVERSRAEIASGSGLTTAQVEEQLAARKAAWLQANPR